MLLSTERVGWRWPSPYTFLDHRGNEISLLDYSPSITVEGAKQAVVVSQYRAAARKFGVELQEDRLPMWDALLGFFQDKSLDQFKGAARAMFPGAMVVLWVCDEDVAVRSALRPP